MSEYNPYPVPLNDAKMKFWLNGSWDAMNPATIPEADSRLPNDYARKLIERDMQDAFRLDNEYDATLKTQLDLADKRRAVNSNNDKRLTINERRLNRTANNAGWYNPVTDKRKMMAYVGGTLGGGALGLGAGYLGSLLVNKEKKKTRRTIQALGALGGAGLGALYGHAYDPGFVDAYSDSIKNSAPKLVDPGRHTPWGARDDYSGWEKLLKKHNGDILNHADAALAARAKDVRNVAINAAKNLQNSRHELAAVQDSINKANIDVVNNNKLVDAYNAKGNPLEAITKARNAQLNRWGNYGGAGLGGITGALGAGYLSRGLFKSKDRRKRILGALLTGAGGLGGAILGNRLGNYFTTNAIKGPDAYQPLGHLTSYPTK